ncbi:hypothetical protein A3Q56_04292 [Intoshia linei]|uniref:Amino acid permease/ SLC12A domain-containing protein n=1 Tax=Intoshia linei TaxID=1819745 RepID=A0A177B149_9BILA|nr:hypothetical protein A3Q56_04292 [Intoshia linei]
MKKGTLLKFTETQKNRLPNDTPPLPKFLKIYQDFTDQILEAFISADIPLYKLNNPKIKTLFNDLIINRAKAAVNQLGLDNALIQICTYLSLLDVIEMAQESSFSIEKVQCIIILIRSICISLPIIIFIYTMVNVSYFTELSYEEMLNSNAVAVSFGFKVHKTFAYIVPFFVGCSTFGSLNGGMLSIPRMYFVAARNNHLPEAFSFVNRTKTPAFAIIFCGMASIFYLFVLDTSSLILMATLVESSAILVCMKQ